MSSMREEVYSKLHLFLEDLVDIACDNIEKLEKEDDWISVKERLPDTDDDVLITYSDINDPDDKGIAITSYYEQYFGGRALGLKVGIHPLNLLEIIMKWMPLPEVYEGD